jgi:hypothetical protein
MIEHVRLMDVDCTELTLVVQSDVTLATITPEGSIDITATEADLIKASMNYELRPYSLLLLEILRLRSKLR